MRVRVGETLRWPLPAHIGYDAINDRTVWSRQTYLDFTVTPDMLAEVLKARARKRRRRARVDRIGRR